MAETVTEASTSGRTSVSLVRVIWASSLGSVFEWYDFFLYGAVARRLSQEFFPAGDSAAGLLLVLATFGSGFAVRPLGGFIFGALGDRVGRKHTFLVTITLMGLATAAIGLLPTYAYVGLWAPVLLVSLRLVQGLALGGEYGGAAIYVAEHAPPERRGFYTSWIQLAAVVGFLLSLVVVLLMRAVCPANVWDEWGWRLPFLLSFVLLGISLYIRVQVRESPVFEAMKARGAVATNPLRESFLNRSNVARMLVALFGVAAGLTVIWFTAQFSSLAVLQQWAGIDESYAKTLVAIATALAAPVFVFCGWLSDKIGRRPLLLTGYVLSLVLTIPLSQQLGALANPARTAATIRAPVVVSGPACDYAVFAGKQRSECGRLLEYLTSKGLRYRVDHGTRTALTVRVGALQLEGFQPEALTRALDSAGYSALPGVDTRRAVLIVLIVMTLAILAALTFGQSAALLVELFPARIRYTSMSVPYHIGTGYFGGFQPFLSQYIVTRTGNPYAGLYYTLAVVAVALLVCLFYLPETRGRDINA
jgi:MFS family permease